jgi:hypothetical protein
MSEFSFIEYYANIRVALFISGFTLGSFLFSMKSLIVSTMKSACYDSDRHKESVRQRRALGDPIGYYSSLRRFSILLTISIAVSILSSIVQITVGFVENELVVLFCLFSAIISWALLAIVLPDYVCTSAIVANR